jgi:hypothetical protein
VLLNDRSHRPWCAGVLAATALALGLFLWLGHGQARWPGGGSALGQTYGGLAAALFVFEASLWLKKRQPFRTMRLLGPAVWWMRAHLWLGLLCVPLVVLHSGLRLRGPLTTVLVIDFALVILSGVVGALVQHWLPRRLTEQVGEETIHSQIGAVMRSHAVEAARLIDDLCGLPPKGAETAVERVGGARDGAEQGPVYRTAFAQRRGAVGGTVVTTRPAVERVEGAEPLRAFFRDLAADYLLRGTAGRSPLRAPAVSDSQFGRLRDELPTAARPVLDMLRQQCDRRRQLDRQAQLHAFLHAWLWLHLPLSAALLLLTAAHALTAWRY